MKQSKGTILSFSSKNEIETVNALDYIGVGFDEHFKCYIPPINRTTLAKLPYANAQHSGILLSRANMVSADYITTKNAIDMTALCRNLIQFGDVGLLKIRNQLGQVIGLHVLSSLYLRVTKEGNYKYLLKKDLFDANNQIYEYKAKDIIFIKLYDPLQQIYGTPDYIGGIQSALLNADATTFRRRYYSNGAHLGFILYTTDPDIPEEVEKEIQQKIKDSKGVGNFRSMFINIPKGDPDGVKVIPIGDTGKKDEFSNIKNISAQDILTAHRFPPGLSGIIPSNTGGLGDPIKSLQAYRMYEVLPLQEKIANTINNDQEVPNWLKVKFRKLEIDQ